MKIGLALGGGGARGFAHLGVLQVLEEAGIHGQVVSGTSIGSLVGAVYAAGKCSELEHLSKQITLSEIPRLLSPTVSKQGFFSGTNALRLLTDVVPECSIESLPIPFAAVSSNLTTSTIKTFTSGSLSHAVRASIAIPILFTPVLDGEMVLVDGGLLDPVPVEAARSLGAECVIAVDLFGTYPTSDEAKRKSRAYVQSLHEDHTGRALHFVIKAAEKLGIQIPGIHRNNDGSDSLGFLDIVERSLMVSQRELTSFRLQQCPAELVVRPDVSHVGFLDFHRGDYIIQAGRDAMSSSLEELQSILQA